MDTRCVHNYLRMASRNDGEMPIGMELWKIENDPINGECEIELNK